MTDPVETFMASPDLLLVDGYKVNLGMSGKLGEPGATPSFFVDMQGRVNNSDERRELRLFFSADFGYKLGDELMTRLEEFVQMMKDRDDV